jgi:MerR-like DNA binding protein
MTAEIVPVGGQPGLLAGYSTREQLARKVGRTVHTIRLWERQGLPVIKRGNLRLYNDDIARQWILGELGSTAPRKPGRPKA